MYFLADIGGTKMRLAVSRGLETFEEPIVLDTPSDYDAGLALIVETARSLASGEALVGGAVGITGVLSPDRTTLSNRRSLAGWNGKPVIADLAAALAIPVRAENDTALVGLGEAHFGAGSGAAILAYLTVSTGVNGVRITDGAIDKTAQGFEIGGQYLALPSTATLEDMISGSAIEARFGMAPKELGPAHAVWEELAEKLAFGLYNTVTHWSPDRVVLGGSMMNEIGISIDRVRARLERINTKYPVLPELAHSGLGDVGGLYGAMALLKQSGTDRVS